MTWNLPTILVAIVVFGAFAAIVLSGVRRRAKGGGCGCSCGGGCGGCAGHCHSAQHPAHH